MAALKVVGFNGHWCGACAAQRPAWVEFARQHRREAVTVDVDDVGSPSYLKYGRVWERERAMPLTVWMVGDRVVEQRTGTLSLAELQRITRKWQKRR